MGKWNWAGPRGAPGHKSLSESPIFFFFLASQLAVVPPQALNLMQKVQPLCAPLLNRILETVLGEVVKNSFLLCQAKRDTEGSSLEMLLTPGAFDEEFYGNSSRVGVLSRLGCVQGLRWSGLLILMSFPLILPQVALLQGGSQFWLHVGDCVFDLLFVDFAIILTPNGLPGGPCPSQFSRL